MSEIRICENCGKERKLWYDTNFEICCNPKDKLINGMKPVDYFIKQTEVQNEKSKPSTRKISKSIKASR
jgi:hypothetical protein